ncbi:AAA family ATPase [Acanthopleuribacter pedis]|uniref:ATP/GTP-binding protein n=1 Tax=Acanthopleuribacter pedis TaxID=442870 RepID=A0A8J7Q696_9BACT|nr:ATP/GTP-binding protein [Acanthopleuribacter pedis]MBO1321277.1 ATP/GTP-binding protein [Acanthopleuribacter pedis]
MLLEFMVKNFLSFEDAASLNMAGYGERIHPHHMVKGKGGNDVNLLRGALIYGANASGKSNLVKALAFVKDFVTRGREKSEPIGYTPYKFSHPDTWTRFEIAVKTKGNIYRYEITLLHGRVLIETLSRSGAHTERLIYKRTTNEEGIAELELGSRFAKLTKKEKQFITFVARGTRPNVLFLTESVERNVKVFDFMVDWFTDSLLIVTPNDKPTNLGAQLVANPDLARFVNKFIGAADTGISRLNVEPVPGTDPGQHPGETRYHLTTQHRSQLGHTEHTFELDEESDGTKRLIDLLPAYYKLTTTPELVVVIDEMGRNLHPELIAYLCEWYFDINPNPVSQLIFTTHHPSLMDLSRLRRGEIWFCEKAPDGATELYSLLEFGNTRYDKDVQTAYRQGRYGAVPRPAQVVDWGKDVV